MSDPQDRAEALDEDVVDTADAARDYPPERPLGAEDAGEAPPPDPQRDSFAERDARHEPEVDDDVASRGPAVVGSVANPLPAAAGVDEPLTDPDVAATEPADTPPADDPMSGTEAGAARPAAGELPCAVCGNRYDKAFHVRTVDGEEFTFDSFECAIDRLAPRCGHCDCRVIGHGTEVVGRMYCCAHCARAAEETDAPTDRVDEQSATTQPIPQGVS